MVKYKKKILIIILPKNDDSSPVKGAIALANYLCRFVNVKIVFLNTLNGNINIDKKIKIYKIKSKFLKIFDLKKIIEKYCAFEVSTLSFCLSADLINLLIKQNVKNISTSVRGNLIKNYLNTYGLAGYIIAKFHYFMIRKFTKIFSMNKSMYQQIKYLTGRKSIITGNFIDEFFHKRFFIKKKTFKYRVIFMGSLDKRKNPLLLINGFVHLLDELPQLELFILGNGPLKDQIVKIKKKNKIKNLKILGNIKNPIKYLINSDLLISTSKSEGISRSVLEALFYGIPVMMSDVDGSGKMIKKFQNGYVFKNDNDFFLNFKKVLMWSRKLSSNRKCLLPYNLRQNFAGKLYLKNLL
tara:strand:+ start:3307 stop:4365 length:1059 start_codon:yes stop_codon:yes gene_type:complete